MKSVLAVESRTFLKARLRIGLLVSKGSRHSNYRYLSNIALADIAFVARGDSLPSLLESSARALTEVMVDRKTVVGKVIGTIDARALPVEPAGYNLLKYCWTASNVLGDWAKRAGLTGAMVVRALETSAWARDLVRAGYAADPVNEAIGRYEAKLVAAGFTDAARDRVDKAGLRPRVQCTRWNSRLQRTVQGQRQNCQAGAPSSTEKKMISARPIRFSAGT